MYGADVHAILVCSVLTSYVQDREHIVSKLGGELLKSSFDKVGLQNPCNFCTATSPFSSVYCHHLENTLKVTNSVLNVGLSSGSQTALYSSHFCMPQDNTAEGLKGSNIGLCFEINVGIHVVGTSVSLGS